MAACRKRQGLRLGTTLLVSSVTLAASLTRRRGRRRKSILDLDAMFARDRCGMLGTQGTGLLDSRDAAEHREETTGTGGITYIHTCVHEEQVPKIKPVEPAPAYITCE